MAQEGLYREHHFEIYCYRRLVLSNTDLILLQAMGQFYGIWSAKYQFRWLDLC